ncbi:MAG: TetR family transcriptional regulator [Solirubrobacteraceae bacterium]
MSARGQARQHEREPGATHSNQNGLGRERVGEVQRARMLAGMFELVGERAAASVTVADVVVRAGVSRRTFYEIFEDSNDCFLAAFDEGVARARRYVFAAYDPGAPWIERVRTALTALLSFLEGERDTGRLLVVGWLSGGTQALERRRRVLTQIMMLIDEGRTHAKNASQLPALTAEGIVGGIASVLHARLLQEDPGGLPQLAGPLMSMIVLPYLGASAARKETERPVPKAPASAPDATPNPLLQLEMRLTYRTLRVLIAVAEHPGSSNRQIAEISGIADQGQMSKLLARLKHIGLIQNTGAGPARGEPNAWTLTGKGRQVQKAMTEQPAHN